MRIRVFCAVSAFLSCSPAPQRGPARSAQPPTPKTEATSHGTEDACPNTWHWVGSGKRSAAPADRAELPPLSRKPYEVAELLADEERVYVVSFVPAAPGAVVRAFDGRTGRSLYELRVGGMTCVHSTYTNRLRIELSRERLLVWGWESAGRYVTAIEPRTGWVLCERLFDEVVCREG
jgi:hypothetical protein